jgi:hypothetical protein
MKKLITTLFMLASVYASGQFVARMEVKEKIPGVCDNKNVYVMFPMFEGQEPAKCPIKEKEILEKLNKEVNYLRDSASYNDKAMMGLVINCKGEVVQCKIDNKTRHPELDAEIEKVLNSLGEWKPGKLNGKKVDTSWLFSFNIVNGKFVE